jgi:hypothetical protein
MSLRVSSAVMAGLVPAIHALLAWRLEDVDTREKPGHDACVTCCVLAEERAH